MLINELKVQPKKRRKRVGRGGKRGTYCGRGGKGQSARKGYSQRATFEGGSTSIVSLSKKKRGFNVLKKEVQLVSIKKIDKKFSAGEVINLKSLKDKNLISSLSSPVKILSDGEINKSVTVEKIAISRLAVEKIEKAGGRVIKEEGNKQKNSVKENKEKN